MVSMMNLAFVVELCKLFEFVELVAHMKTMDDVVVHHKWNVAVVVEPKMMVNWSENVNVNASVMMTMRMVGHTMAMELMELMVVRNLMMELIKKSIKNN